MNPSEVAVIGGGIVGLASAYHLTRAVPRRRVLVLEKEAQLAHHQSGHNSGVLHSGIYYRPGSLRALNCRAGRVAMQAFCAEAEIPFEICGKVIVAVGEADVPALLRIYERGQANGVNCALIGKERLQELEPYAAGVQAIHIPESGIVDYRQVCRRLAQEIKQRDGRIVTGARLTAIRQTGDEVALQTTAGDFSVPYAVNCTGLYSDRVTRLSGARPDVQIVPFRGEYYELTPSARSYCRNLIYPVPDPSFPFLGVHFTRTIDGRVECGPNAVLAFAREGYHKTDFDLGDLAESLTYRGFLRLAGKYWRTGLGELWRSFNKAAFVHALQRLLPAIRKEHLVSAPAGVRAQAVSRDGALVDDFVIRHHGRVINVCNAPSPAATASLNIGSLIARQLA